VNQVVNEELSRPKDAALRNTGAGHEL
jgi:hypothetical protein